MDRIPIWFGSGTTTISNVKNAYHAGYDIKVLCRYGIYTDATRKENILL